MNNISVVVVTYNRKDLLVRCLEHISQQTLPPSNIIIVDNASTDGTSEVLDGIDDLHGVPVTVLRLPSNTGGAGGFHAGLKHAADKGADMVWMMDDDAFPYINALEELAATATNPNDIYCSTAIYGSQLSWPNGLRNGRRVQYLKDLPDIAEVNFVPFLGFFIHRQLIEKIGYPESEYFIAADDVEYCRRAQKIADSKIYLVANSRLDHPPASDYSITIVNRKIWCLKLPPWKRYYDTRNRILIARKHDGAAVYYKTLPASFVRLFGSLIHENKRLPQTWAFIAGLIDGLLGIKGNRHQTWRIPQ